MAVFLCFHGLFIDAYKTYIDFWLAMIICRYSLLKYYAENGL
jgi:hypothetical protein